MRLILITTASLFFATAAMAASPSLSSVMSVVAPGSQSQPAMPGQAATSQNQSTSSGIHNMTCQLSSAQGAKTAQTCHYNCSGKDVSLYTPNTDCAPSITKTF